MLKESKCEYIEQKRKKRGTLRMCSSVNLILIFVIKMSKSKELLDFTEPKMPKQGSTLRRYSQRSRRTGRIKRGFPG